MQLNEHTMSTLSKILTLVLLCTITFSCGEEESEPASENEEIIQLQKLAKTWIPVTIMKDDEEVSSRFPGFTITFTQQKTYATTLNRGGFDVEPFKASGTWDFGDNNLNVVSRDDGVDMNISVTETRLTLRFQIVNPNGRTLGLGEYDFELAPQ